MSIDSGLWTMQIHLRLVQALELLSINLRFLGIVDFGHFKSCWYLQLFIFDNSYLVEQSMDVSARTGRVRFALVSDNLHKFV